MKHCLFLGTLNIEKNKLLLNEYGNIASKIRVRFNHLRMRQICRPKVYNYLYFLSFGIKLGYT
jgi:hypothetical protein